MSSELFIYNYNTENTDLQYQYAKSLLSNDCLKIIKDNTSEFRPNYEVKMNTTKGEMNLIIYVSQVDPSICKDASFLQVMPRYNIDFLIEHCSMNLRKHKNLFMSVVSEESYPTMGRLLFECISDKVGQDVLLHLAKKKFGDDVFLKESTRTVSKLELVKAILSVDKVDMTEEETCLLVRSLFQ